MNMRSYNKHRHSHSAPKEVQELSKLLKLVGDATRLRILFILNEYGEHCVCDLGDRVDDLSQSLISHHLSDLKKAGILKSQKIGLRVHYQLTDYGRNIMKTVLSLMDKKAAAHNKSATKSSPSVCGISPSNKKK